MELEFKGIKSWNVKKLIGLQTVMSISDNRTGLLWKNFMQRQYLFPETPDKLMYSVQVFPENFNFIQFDIKATFTKWAAREIYAETEIPEGMQELKIPGGDYAVFWFKGAISEAPEVFRKIFTEWLPSSKYEIDYRPHFEIIGEKYSNHSPDSEEEIWIPVKNKV